MNAFDQLHPALQHHVVNSLGWSDLRPFQKEVIPPILEGQHLIILAPTAGGKTEAAVFPVLSRMLFEGWSGLSVLYICPIKALLNNLDVRLQRYCSLLGRQSALWHGDVKTSGRKRILRDPPDCLLTTPESLEVMLVSPNVNERSLFAQLSVVIIDEIHAFAGDDRGWHLLAVIERIQRLAGREMQRIGLSATVGNPSTLIDWIAGTCKGHRSVFRPETSAANNADVKIDFVGSLQNAALVLSRLNRGEKRLAFVDSRSRAEQLASQLRQLEVTTFVTHSSLSHEQRKQAEAAFANRNDCVIVATSVLELGIDVGDLDRVIQIDCPPTVSSFLQRMGRTGRRPGAARNCLFLATADETLVQAAGLVSLWDEGYVEPIEPPLLPMHVLAQQLMALILQQSGIGRADWFQWVQGVPGFAAISSEHIERLVDSMLERGILWEEAGIMSMGPTGERTYGHKNFMELYSVFMSPPLFSILHGRQELGYVDEMTFLGKHEGPRVLLLGGQAWQVNHIDWQRRVAYVEATNARGQTRWKGEGRGLGFRLSQAIKHVLTAGENSPRWSNRAIDRISEMRQAFTWLRTHCTSVLQGDDNAAEWWTFAGNRANATLARQLMEGIDSKVNYDSFTLTFEPRVTHCEIERAIATIRDCDAAEMRPAVDSFAIDGLKFSACLPIELAREMLERRMQDQESTRHVLNEHVSFLIQ